MQGFLAHKKLPPVGGGEGGEGGQRESPGDGRQGRRQEALAGTPPWRQH